MVLREACEEMQQPELHSVLVFLKSGANEGLMVQRVWILPGSLGERRWASLGGSPTPGRAS
jgi:hypothetical protein